jgi:hypothetical protein
MKATRSFARVRSCRRHSLLGQMRRQLSRPQTGNSVLRLAVSGMACPPSIAGYRGARIGLPGFLSAEWRPRNSSWAFAPNDSDTPQRFPKMRP